MKKLLCLIFALIAFTLCFSGCGGAYNGESDGGETSVNSGGEQTAKANMLYGMCYAKSERADYEKYIQVDVQLMQNLGVGSVRNWMHFSDLLLSKNKVNEKECAKMHAMLSAQKNAGMTVIGMNHTNFNNGTNISGKPARNIEKDSYYTQWLLDYYTSWKTLVAEFPEVDYWEIDNEINNSDFMKDTQGQVVYSMQEMADISADMLFYASKGIHSANKSAITVMGGITEPHGLGHGENVEFLELLYSNIESGNFGYVYGLENESNASKNPDDYFQVACWHPYVWTDGFDEEFFISENNKIYNVIKKHEPQGKDVFFTEIGQANDSRTEQQTADFVTKMYKTAESLGYVKVVNYFKLFDVAKVTWTGKFSRYGLFYDPDISRTYTQSVGDDLTTPLANGAPKLSAYAFQKVSGGKGSLELLINKNEG